MKLLLTTDEVCAELSISKTTIERLVKANIFPKPCYIGGNKRWRGVDVQNWANSLVDENDPTQPTPAALDKPKRGRPRLAI